MDFDELLDCLPSAEEIQLGTRQGPTPGNIADMIAVLEYDLWEKFPSHGYPDYISDDVQTSSCTLSQKPLSVTLDFPNLKTHLPCLEGRLPVIKYLANSHSQNAVVHGRLSGEYITAFLNSEIGQSAYRSVFVCVPDPSTASYVKIMFVDKAQWERDVYSLSSPSGRFVTILRCTFVYH